MDKKVELKVINISNSQAQASAYAMVLQEVDGDRQLPIIIGSSEAQSIALRLKNIKTPRPLTHDLFTSALTEFDIIIAEVLIYKALDGVFYSYIYLKKENKTVCIDARTSDAIALAIRFYCPIYIYESIMEKECIPTTDNEGYTIGITGSNEEELKKENINSLKQALAKAVEEENYELASILRDEISRRQ